MIILSACDINYKPMMECLVNSVLRNTPYQIIAHYLNRKDLANEELRDYCANYRINMFWDHMHTGHNLLWLDADSLVRGDISELDELLNENATISVHTPEMGQEGSMNSWLISTVGISQREDGKLFLKEWMRRHHEIYLAWMPSIMTCQQSYVDCLKGTKVKDITYHYSDKNMMDDSPIWEAQGSRKTDPRWLAEQAKYR